jgi:hypothetical protein
MPFLWRCRARNTAQRTMSTDEPLIEILAREIEDYVTCNTHAADGIEGIMRWWLGNERRGKTVELVQAALDALERKGVVRRSVLQDGHVIYARGQ